MSSDSNRWRLIDLENPLFDDNEGFPTTAIQTEQHLRNLLEHYRPCSARIFHFNTAKVLIEVGIGGPFAFLRYYPSVDHSQSFTAISVKKVSNRPACFLDEGQPANIEPQDLMLVSDAIEIAACFFITQQMAPWVNWEPT
jgi:hypothetical protein